MSHSVTLRNSKPTIELLLTSDLKSNLQNPRTHPPAQIRQLAASIKAFGCNSPILVDGENNIVSGNARLAACQLLRWDRVPCIRLDQLNEHQVRAFSIADNRLTELAEWNPTLLGEVFKGLAVVDLDFSLEITGFSPAEIDLYIEGISEETLEDDLHGIGLAIAERPQVTREGDIWRAGQHLFICADARDPVAYARLLGTDQAQVVFTDPPYNVAIRGNVSGKGAIVHGDFRMATGELTPDKFTAFLAEIFAQLRRHTTAGSMHFICMDWRHQLEISLAGRQVYDELKNVCVWVKPNGGMGSLYRSRHEFIYVFKSGRGSHINNVELGRHGRSRTNVWEYEGIHNFGRSGEEGNLLALHPTVKPVKLIADALLDCSERGALVLDPCIGIGSTAIAAERVGRRCRGIEIDPTYVDTAIRRWQKLTGDHAVHVSSGLSFDEIATQTHD